MLNIQEAIQSSSWVNDEIHVVYDWNDIALARVTDSRTSIEPDVQDILAEDWYLLDSILPAFPTDRKTGERGARDHAKDLSYDIGM